ncbi:MAG: aldo/keto reductase [Myxococcota bacterium]
MGDVGLGCMRLSTDPKRTEADAIAVLQSAHQAGVTLFNTAASYGPGERGMHANEALLAKVLDARATIISKGGMRRPRGGWLPDGRRKTILADAERSVRALGRAADVLLLHAPDPKTDFATSIRALRAAKEGGLARAVGLSNVRLDQLRRAQELVDIHTVELAINPFDEDAVRGGVVRYCLDHGIRVLAHSPLGGPKRYKRLGSEGDLGWLADAHQTTPQTIVLAWLYSLGVVPLPGATRPETAALAGRAGSLSLRDDERSLLDELFPLGRLLRTTPAERRPRAPRGKVILFMGIPAAGKTSSAKKWTDDGYQRLSRDERGGTLKDLATALANELEEGATQVLMDATYPSRAARNRVIETAWEAGASVRCVFFDTPLAEAQINAIDRMLDRRGALLSPEELKVAAKEDPNLFPPAAQLRFQRAFEAPTEDEGFADVERITFERRPLPEHTASGVVVDLEALVDPQRWPGATPFARVEKLRGRTEAMLVLAWLPQIGAGRLDPAKVEAAFQELALPATLAYCPHEAGPLRCWCRKPVPGLVVEWMRRERVAPSKVTYIGASAGSERLAQQLGFLYVPASSL